MPAGTELLIGHLGAEGDGVGRLADGASCYVANGLPGERVRLGPLARRGDGFAAEIVELVEASPHRVTPACPHFGSCGGCVLQHAGIDLYTSFKSDLLSAALRRAGFAEAVRPLQRTPPASRRRLDLAVAKAGGRVLLGLHQRFGSLVVDLRTCPVSHPALVALLPALRGLLGGLDGLRVRGSVALNLLDDGPDVLLGTDRRLSTADRTRCAAFAAELGVPRVSWSDGGATETVAQLRTAAVTVSGHAVRPPPGAFLQASAEGEAAIRAAVVAGLPGFTRKSRIVELYAGVGTLTFALAEHARVQAYEGAADAAAALRTAAGGQRIEVTTRDLVRQPLSAAELKGAACVVLDPPFAGAGPQVAQIAAAGVGRVIYVSCNPAALTRDLRAMKAAGYRVVAASPVDQFLWSARLESVVVLSKEKATPAGGSA